MQNFVHIISKSRIVYLNYLVSASRLMKQQKERCKIEIYKLQNLSDIGSCCCVSIGRSNTIVVSRHKWTLRISYASVCRKSSKPLCITRKNVCTFVNRKAVTKCLSSNGQEVQEVQSPTYEHIYMQHCICSSTILLPLSTVSRRSIFRLQSKL